MSKILILGNSLAVGQVIEDIRRDDKESVITLFCTEGVLPYDRLSLPVLIAGKIKEAQIHPLPLDFFKQHGVELVLNEKLLRISLKRKYVTTENKKQIDYDRLLVADLGVLAPLAVKGHQKKGVFDTVMFSSVKRLIKELPFADTIFVSVTNLQGLNAACALFSAGKDVVIICSHARLLPDVLDEETAALLKQILEGKGIRVIVDNAVEEILGDAEMKAVRLVSGKVMAAQAMVVDILPLDTRMLTEDSGYEMVKDDYFSVHKALGPTHFGFNALEGFCVGVTKLPEGGREYLKFDGPQNVFKKVFAQGDVLVGAVLFNSASHEKEILKTITERVSIEGREEALLGG